MKRICMILAVLAVILCGCENADKGGTGLSNRAITFTDALDRTVTVDQPKRVAALLGSFAEVWVLSGGDLVAAPEDAWSDFSLELPNTVNIGGAHSPNLEMVLSSNPDFVIASASTTSNVEMKDTLEAVGITVAYFDVDHFEDYLNMLDICTDITGRKDLFEQNGTQIQQQIHSIKQQINAAKLSEQERTVLLLRASSGFVKAKGSTGTILGEMLADIGCINIADSDTSLLETLSAESVIRKNPRHIFVVTMGDDTQKAMDQLQKMMDENPAWGMLDAVKEDRMYVMDRKLFNIKPNARWAESYDTIKALLLGEQ